LPVPPFPVTTCSRCGHFSLTAATLSVAPARGPATPAAVTAVTSQRPGYGAAMQKWEYVTVPLLVHATKQILDSWGQDGWELVAVIPGPNSEQLVAYLKRPKGES
jgi:hypothetical protein